MQLFLLSKKKQQQYTIICFEVILVLSTIKVTINVSFLDSFENCFRLMQWFLLFLMQPTTVAGTTRTAGATTTEIQGPGVAITATNNQEAATTTTARAPTTKEAAVATVSPRYYNVLYFNCNYYLFILLLIIYLNYK